MPFADTLEVYWVENLYVPFEAADDETTVLMILHFGDLLNFRFNSGQLSHLVLVVLIKLIHNHKVVKTQRLMLARCLNCDAYDQLP